MAHKPAYIVIEGAQGVGKTTIARMVVEKLEELGVSAQLTHEPDGDYDKTTREIRRITQDPDYPMNSRTEALLYNAARSQSLDGIAAAKSNGTSTIA
ncbi:dTMP kinase, partial [Candidatus Saccharibacteria bacterium]|nr:dTMP kinase [Candidatus Saccharibacteria bacterium]